MRCLGVCNDIVFCVARETFFGEKIAKITAGAPKPCVFHTVCFGSQGIMWPQVISGAMGNVLNAVINYILLSVLDLGIA